MDCNYHRLLYKLNERIWELMEPRYQWPYLEYWLGDESYFDDIYKEVFEEVLGITLSDAQKKVVEKKGKNMEVAISKWEYPTKKCLELKIFAHICYQLKQKDLRELVGESC